MTTGLELTTGTGWDSKEVYYSIVCSNLLDSTVLLIFPNSLTNTIPTIYINKLGNTSPLVYGPIIQLSNHDINVEMQCDISLNYPFLSAVKKNHKRNLELDKFEAENSTFTYLFINVSFKFGYYNVSTHFPMSLSKSADQYHSTILGKHICLYISIVYKFLIILPCF